MSPTVRITFEDEAAYEHHVAELRAQWEAERTAARADLAALRERLQATISRGQIATVEALDALPLGHSVIDREGDIWVHIEGTSAPMWGVLGDDARAGCVAYMESADLLSEWGPLALRPDPAPGKPRFVIQDGRRYVQGPHDWVDIGPDEDPAPDDAADLWAEVDGLRRLVDSVAAEAIRRERDLIRAKDIDIDDVRDALDAVTAERDAARADLAALREGLRRVLRQLDIYVGRGDATDWELQATDELRALLDGTR